MAYRTKTYIAADWDGDKNAVERCSIFTSLIISDHSF